MHRVRVHICWSLVIFASLLISGCEPSSFTSKPDKTPVIHISTAGAKKLNQHKVAIYVTSNGWHSGIVVSKPPLPKGSIPEAKYFPDALYLSFGWGDETYYQTPTPTLGMTLRAAFVPPPSVVHMSGLAAHPREIFVNIEIVELHLSIEQVYRLFSYLDATFSRPALERTSVTTQGFHQVSHFYPATGEFHLFNTCNTWTARGLRQAGLSIRVDGTLTAEDLMAQVRQLP